MLSAIPTSMIDGAIYAFSGERISVPLSTKSTLGAIQKALHKIDMSIHILQKADSGYALDFGAKKLTGSIKLKYETNMLSTIHIKVRKGISRQKSIEMAVINSIQEQVKIYTTKSALDLSAFLPIRNHPDIKRPAIGWYRQGAPAQLQSVHKQGWLLISLPAGGEHGYILAVLTRQPEAEH